MRIPPDRKILERIYSRYYKVFASYTEGKSGRSTKVYVPVDIDDLAQHFNVDPDIIFGRLHFHLEKKYGYDQSDGTRAAFFAVEVENDPNCVNFPLLSSVLAGMQEEWNRQRWTMGFAIVALVLSLLSIAITLLTS